MSTSREIIFDENTDLKTLQEMLANVTRRLNQTRGTPESPPAPVETSPDYYSPTFLIMFVLCVSSIIANSFSLFVVCNIKYKTTHIRLIISLCLSDGLVGIASLIEQLDIGKNIPCSHLELEALNKIAFTVTLFNLLFMGIDHYLAIVRPLHYPLQMTSRRGIALILCIWLFSILLGHSEHVVALPSFLNLNETMNYCTFVMSNLYDTSFVIFAIIIICILMKTYIYTKILIEIKNYRERATNNPDLAKNRKALITTFIILGTFTICWVPVIFINVIPIIHMHHVGIEHFNPFPYIQAGEYFEALMLLNALLDPIIYSIRMAEVRRSYRKLTKRFWKLCGKKRYQQNSLLDRTTRSTMRTQCTESVKRKAPLIRDTAM